MSDGEWVVGDEAPGEDLLVALARLLGLGEVVGEVGADQLLPSHASDLDGALVDVGDLAFGADGDEWVEARLEQAAGVLGGLFACGVVDTNQQITDDRVLGVAQGGDGDHRR